MKYLTWGFIIWFLAAFQIGIVVQLGRVTVDDGKGAIHTAKDKCDFRDSDGDCSPLKLVAIGSIGSIVGMIGLMLLPVFAVISPKSVDTLIPFFFISPYILAPLFAYLLKMNDASHPKGSLRTNRS